MSESDIYLEGYRAGLDAAKRLCDNQAGIYRGREAERSYESSLFSQMAEIIDDLSKNAGKPSPTTDEGAT